MESTLRRIWAEIDLDALAHNYRVLRAHMGTARFLGVVKADAYGHGAVQVARTLEELGAEYLAVSNVDEARELRAAGVEMPILQMGVTPADQTEAILRHRITQTIYNESSAIAFSKAATATGGRMRGHIKLDTGMTRLGFQCDEAHFAASLAAICRVYALPGLELEGIFTHFAVADELDEESRDFTRLQFARFRKMVNALAEQGITFSMHHCANSGATANYPQFAEDMFRPGLLTYGAGPQARELGLRPVMTLKTIVGTLKDCDAGSTVSYGRTARLTAPSRVAVLPIGYADGFHRVLSGQWKVWTANGFAPVLGRICMDMCMVDVSGLRGVAEGNEVEIYGPHCPVEAAAAVAGTIPYELLCAVSRRVPKVYFRHDREIARELLLRG